MTPSEAILEFLAARPNTIRDNLYWQVGMGVDDNCIPGGIESDIVSFVTKFLTGGTKLRNFKNAILVGAVLDHVFSRPHSREWAKEFERIRAACCSPFGRLRFGRRDAFWLAYRLDGAANARRRCGNQFQGDSRTWCGHR